jgi:uncharacterized protein YndB with AHSA1/START domain
MSATKITIETTIAADVKKVWDYYNKPEHITKWNFAIDTWQCPSATARRWQTGFSHGGERR